MYMLRTIFRGQTLHKCQWFPGCYKHLHHISVKSSNRVTAEAIKSSPSCPNSQRNNCLVWAWQQHKEKVAMDWFIGPALFSLCPCWKLFLNSFPVSWSWKNKHDFVCSLPFLVYVILDRNGVGCGKLLCCVIYAPKSTIIVQWCQNCNFVWRMSKVVPPSRFIFELQCSSKVWVSKIFKKFFKKEVSWIWSTIQ